jgi:hypothetical protein
MSTNAAAEEDRSSEVVPAIEPTVPWRVSGVRVVEHGLLTVRFVDGTEGNVDMRALLQSDRVLGTVFEPLRDSSFFSRAAARLGAVEWPGEIDLAPDAMYDEIRAHGVWILD